MEYIDRKKWYDKLDLSDRHNWTTSVSRMSLFLEIEKRYTHLKERNQILEKINIL